METGVSIDGEEWSLRMREFPNGALAFVLASIFYFRASLQPFPKSVRLKCISYF